MRLHARRIGCPSLLFLLFILGPWASSHAQTLATPRTTPTGKTASTDLASLPLPAQAVISATLGKEDPAYHAVAEEKGLHLTNPRHGLTAAFTASGVEVQRGTARWAMTLTGYGSGPSLSPVAPAVPRAQANRVDYRRGPLTEWYVNGPLGLEQGVTIAAPPPGRSKGPLTLAFTLGGDLTATRDPQGAGLTLTRGGAPALRYTGLTAFDATGRSLPAWLDLQGKTLRLRVKANGARYPLVVDPFIQLAKLTASDGAGSDGFGHAVAISGDTVVVGAEGDNSLQGSAYVFVKPGGGWTTTSTFTAKLTASDGAGGDQFGFAVAISGDTVVVGAPFDDIGANGNQGSAYVFVKPGGGWVDANEDAKLTASDGAGGDQFGNAVAISGDTVVVGAGGDNIGAITDQGSAYVFVKPGGGWGSVPDPQNETAKLTASDGGAFDQFGNAVAISGDTVVVGAPFDNIGAITDQGSAYVFVKPGGGWATGTETAKLTASDGGAFDQFGFAVAISGDTVVVGARADDSDQGSAYVFVKPGGGWADANETAKLTASDGAGGDQFGFAVAISGDTVVVGAPFDDIGANGNQGSAYVFVKPGGGWADANEDAKLTASDGAGGDQFGFAVAISGDTVVVGAFSANIGINADQGAAYIFSDVPSLIKQSVIASLKALLPTGNTTTDILLKVAITSLTHSLKPSYYVDATHLKKNTGINVFTFEQVAVRQLQAIKNPPAAIATAFLALRAADEGFAQTAIDDAIARGGNAGKIAKAQAQLAQAQAATNPFKAIGLFRSAWQTAMGA